MDDTIYRQAAIDAMCDACSDWCDEGVCKRVSALQQLPPAQPERKRGKWIHGQEVCREYIGITLVMVQYSHWECSVCGYRTEKEPLWNYCPNCGAEMWEREDG
jgi:hypothetical protein